MKLVKTALVLAAAAVLVGVPAASWGEDFFYPESWEGVWETTFTEYDCDTNEETDSGVDVADICGGDPFEADFGDEFDINCTGSFTDNSIDISCIYSDTVEGCTITFSYVTQGTRSGNNASGTSTSSITYTGDCFIFLDDCWREEFEAERLVGEDPNCSGTPVTAQSWGVLKSHYR